MNKQDEKRVREIVREEMKEWYLKNVVMPRLEHFFKGINRDMDEDDTFGNTSGIPSQTSKTRKAEQKEE